jgi:tetratricopeptide (TPR) repeat protein
LRYRLLESTRAYGLEKLAENSEWTALARRHAEWMGVFAEQFERSWAQPPELWIADAEPEIDNVRAALNWALKDESGDGALGGQIAGKLVGYWSHRARAEGRHWIESALAKITTSWNPRIVAQLWLALSSTTFAKRRVEAAASAVSIFDELADQCGLARALHQLAGGLIEAGQLDEALAAIDRALQLYRVVGFSRVSRFVAALDMRAAVVLQQGRIDEALASLEEALALSESIADDGLTVQIRSDLAEVAFARGNTRHALGLVIEILGIPAVRGTPMESQALNNSAAYSLALEDAPRARVAAHAGLSLARTLQRDDLVVNAIQHLAAALALQGDARRAAPLLGYVDAWFSREGCKREPTEAKSYDILMAALRNQLSKDEIAMLAAAGAHLDDVQASDEAVAI